jgi:uncharacterized protein YcfL
MRAVKRLPLILVLLAACRSHDPHRVTDLETGTVYHTKEMRRGLTSGHIYLKDAKTGAEVTVRESKVEEISEEDFRLATGAK